MKTKKVILFLIATLGLFGLSACDTSWGSGSSEDEKPTEIPVDEVKDKESLENVSLDTALFSNECTNSRTSDVFVGAHTEHGQHKIWFVRKVEGNYLVIKPNPIKVKFDPIDIVTAQRIHMQFDDEKSLLAEPGDIPFTVDLESLDSDATGKSYQYGGTYTTIDGKKFSKVSGLLSCDRQSLTLGGITYKIQ